MTKIKEKNLIRKEKKNQMKCSFKELKKKKIKKKENNPRKEKEKNKDFLK